MDGFELGRRLAAMGYEVEVTHRLSILVIRQHNPGVDGATDIKRHVRRLDPSWTPGFSTIAHGRQGCDDVSVVRFNLGAIDERLAAASGARVVCVEGSR